MALTLAGPVHSELLIRKSRFIGCVQPVAQALLDASKRPLQRLITLRCTVPYALEGWLRRELESAGASDLQVSHGMAVELSFRLPETAAAALTARLNEGGQGRLAWVEA